MTMGYGMEEMGNKELLENLEQLDANEAAALEPALMEIPGMGEVLVSGDPFAVADQLDDNQGDNILNAQGDCGLVSVANLLTLAGLDVSEDEIVVTAVGNGLCRYSTELEPDQNGGTNVYLRQALLAGYGISSTVYGDDADGKKLSLESIAQYVEAGHGVNLAVNAGYAWDEPSAIMDGGNNHSLIVTGTVRDPESGELKGLIVCDSGLVGTESGARVMSVSTLNSAYTNVTGATALITDDPIRA